VTLQLKAKAGIDYRFCVEESCEAKNGAISGEQVILRIPVKNASAKVVNVSFSATPTASGGAKVNETRSAKLKKIQPNGPSCPPTAYAAAFSYAPSTGLHEL